MAAGRIFACNVCAHSIEAWDEGDPYYRDARGRKRYAYHPDPDRGRCTGVDSPVLCLSCGRKAVRDSAAPITHCRKCASAELIDVWQLEGRPCPYCKQGSFAADPNFWMVS